MSKKHPVKSTQSSARTTAATAAATRAPARPEQRPRPDQQASPGVRNGSSRATPATSPEARARMIAEAAYYLSEQRGFAPGHEVEDWLAAEQQIDSRIEDGRGVLGPMQIS